MRLLTCNTGVKFLLTVVGPLLTIFLGACGEALPTEPRIQSQCSQLQTVFRGSAFYDEKTETEREFEGTLVKKCPEPTPNGRDHCYFLEGTPVYSGGNETAKRLEPFIGKRVKISGKLLDLGFGLEIWPGAICGLV